MLGADWKTLTPLEVFGALYPDAQVGDVFTANRNNQWLYVYLGKSTRCPSTGDVVLSRDATLLMAQVCRRFTYSCETSQEALRRAKSILEEASVGEVGEPILVALYKRRHHSRNECRTFAVTRVNPGENTFTLGRDGGLSDVQASSAIFSSNATGGRGIQLRHNEEGVLKRILIPQEITLTKSEVGLLFDWGDAFARNETRVTTGLLEVRHREWLRSEEYRDIIADGQKTGFTVHSDDVLF